MRQRPRISLTLGVSLLLTGLITAAPVQAAPPPAAPPEGFGEAVDVNVINVDVHVTDKNGNPVRGLRQDEFEILEDGRPVEVSYFAEIDRGATPASPDIPAAAAAPAAAAPANPLQLVVYIDNLHIRATHRTRVLRQLRELLSSGIHPDDRVMVVTFDHGLRILQPFTADRDHLVRALDAVERMTARGDETMRARRTTLENTLSLLELAASISSATSRGQGAGGRQPGDGSGPVQGGSEGGGGEGGEDSGEGAAAISGARDPICRMDVAEPVRAYAQATRQEVLASIDALKALLSSLSGLSGRKALLHVSDGLPVTPGEELFQALFLLCGGGGAADGIGGIDPSGASNNGYRAESALIDAQSYSTAKDWTLLAAHANNHRVTLYTLQASGLETLSAAGAHLAADERLLQLSSVDSVELQNRQGSLSVMASDTGGRAIFNTNDIRPDFDRMRRDFDLYYSLGFAPRRAGDRRDHRLEVRLKRRDLKVRHPRSYRDRTPLEIAAERTFAALFYQQEDNPLEVALEIGEARPQSGGSFHLPVRLKIPLHKLFFQDNQVELSGKIRLLVATQAPNGEPSRLRQVEIPLKIPRAKALVALGQHHLYELTLTLPAGDQRVAVAVRDEGTSLASFLARNVHVGKEGQR